MRFFEYVCQGIGKGNFTNFGAMDKYAHLTREELIQRLEEKESGVTCCGDADYPSVWKNTESIRKITGDVLNVLLHTNLSEAIDKALVEILNFFGVDRAYIFVYDWSRSKGMSLAYEVTRNRLFTLRDELQYVGPDDFPWWFDRVRQGLDIVVPDIALLPPEAAAEKEILGMQRIVSLINIPLFSGGKVFASLGLDAVRQKRNWSRLERESLRLLGDIVSIAIERRKVIEELQRSEQQLQKSEEKHRQKAEQIQELLTKFKFVAGTSDSLLWEYDVRTDRLEVQLELVDGSPADGHPFSLKLYPFCNKQDFYNLIYPADREYVFDNHFDRLLKGEINQYALSYRRLSTNGYIWVHASVRTYKWDAEGKPAKVIYYLTNIDDQVKQRERIDSLNALMSILLENVPVVVTIKDVSDDFRYLYFNAAAEQYNGVKSAEAIGRTDREIYGDERKAERIRAFDRLAVEKGTYSDYALHDTTVTGEERIVNSIRVFIDGISGKGMEASGKQLLVTVMWDITRERRNEVALIEAQEADKLKTAFLAHMSHEIRTPLNAIVGFSNLLAETDDPQERETFRDLVNRNNDRLLQLLNDVLDFSELETDRMTYGFGPVALKAICTDRCRAYSRRSRNGVPLLFDAGELPEITVHADERRVRQVLSNLLSNAIKFTETGHIRVWYEVRKKHVRVSVSDTGVGIPAEKQHAIFQSFIKLDSFKEGTGLGLTLCKMMVEKMGGTMGVDSVEGKGSLFWFTLPLMPPGAVGE